MAKSKKEIDKEIMFNKIMPTSLKNATLIEAAAEAEPDPETIAGIAEAQKKAVHGSPVISESTVQVKGKNNDVLVNIMEYLVVEKLDSAFTKFKCCKCDKCRKDVAAIALNKLTPKYIVVDPDRITAWTALQSGTDVMTAIIQGVLQVRANPRH